jgi:hypothetical protein
VALEVTLPTSTICIPRVLAGVLRVSQGCSRMSYRVTDVPRISSLRLVCSLHTVEVVGSNPAVPTIESTTYRFRA